MRDLIKKLLRENFNNKIICYHGTSSAIPFTEFSSSMIGSGIVSNGVKHKGFYFTTEKENADFYTEWFVAKVEIFNVNKNPTSSKHPPSVLNLAFDNNKIYLIEDVLDGAIFSNIIVVPITLINNVKIIEWEFVGDKDTLFDKYDEWFGDEDGYVNKDMVLDALTHMNIDIPFLMNIPVFKEYIKIKSNN